MLKFLISFVPLRSLLVRFKTTGHLARLDIVRPATTFASSRFTSTAINVRTITADNYFCLSFPRILNYYHEAALYMLLMPTQCRSWERCGGGAPNYPEST
jgi:hypothetical protein